LNDSSRFFTQINLTNARLRLVDVFRSFDMDASGSLDSRQLHQLLKA